ncbi:synaptotagmin-like protein 2 isoform X2 [Perognathus longimembris pacificus]|uniref:synaptotagmin-like protein 2 isoform X2 n=1 Tax=Perognathus longimembris pacificus TaxID=214514 RepID=UPI00201A1BDD|nr:synaptotagmin-like protein 2 isoform X2 [Perognathus longimembris pacificus]
MIDLSFLTEEEQEAIMKVLQRDAALKRAEEERVRHLPEKIKDGQQLKNMSGQWFYEAKAKRHRDKIHGADVIRASMRRRRLPGAAEQSKDRAIGAKESWVNNVNKDAFLLPEVAGVVEEPEEDTAPASASSSAMSPATTTTTEASPENTSDPTTSPAKQRKNPFNSSKLPEDHLSQQTKNEQSKNGRAGLFQISKEGELFKSKGKPSPQGISSQMLEKPKQPMPEGPVSEVQVQAPVPKARKLIYKSNDSKQDDNQPFPRHRADSLNARAAPRGILKRNSSSSSTDSETLHLHHTFEPRSKIVSPAPTIHERIAEQDLSLEDDSSSCSLEPLKHVRFSAVTDELPQSSGLIHGREVGEFSVLESDKMKNGTEGREDIDEFLEDLTPSHRKVLPFHESRSSSSVTKNETQPPVTSGSDPNHGFHSYSEVWKTRAPSIEDLPTSSEHQDESPEFTRLQSELPPNPAGDLSHYAEPDPAQVLDPSSRDHQQGKLPLLSAKTSLHSGSYVSETRKTTDDSISKVLDWFNRSSHSDDSSSALQHSQGIESKETTDSTLRGTVALETDDGSLKENDSKASSLAEVTLKPVRSDFPLRGEGDRLFSKSCKDNDVNNKGRSMSLSQHAASESLRRPFESYGPPSQGSENADLRPNAISTGKGTGEPTAAGDDSYRAPRTSDTQVQAPRSARNSGSLGEEELKLPVQEKHRANTEVNAHSRTVVPKPDLKDDVEAELKSIKGNSSILKASFETGTREVSPGAAGGGSPWQDAREDPKKRVQREKYVRVSERISFWEGEKAGAKLTHQEPVPSSSQEQPCAKICQPLKSRGRAVAMNEYCPVTAKRVVLDDDGQVPPVSSFDSSNQSEASRPQLPGPAKDSHSADQSETLSVFPKMTCEPVKQLAIEDNRCSMPPLLSPENTESERQTPLEKNRPPIGESNANFKVMSLRERIDEPNTQQVYNHSQFENLRKFWDLGAHSKDNFENTMDLTKPILCNHQKHKEFNDIKSSGKNVPEVETLLSHKNLMAREEMKKLNSKCTLQVLPDETTLLLKPLRMSAHQVAGNEPSKENVEKNTEWLLTPVLKEGKDHSTQETEESRVKTRVLSTDNKVTFHDSLQQLCPDASLPPIQSFDGKVRGKFELKPDISENRTQKAHYPHIEEDPKGPKEVTIKEIVKEHVDKTVAPPKFTWDTLAASLDKLLKEATGTSHSPLQNTLEPITTRTNAQPEEEKGIKRDPNTSAYLREIIAPFPEKTVTLGGVAITGRAGHGECQFPGEILLQMAEKGPPLLGQASPPQRKHSFEDETNSAKDEPFTCDAHLAPYARALPFRREMSETIEQVILPSKPVLDDVNNTLQRLLEEVCVHSPPEKELGPGEVKAEFPEGVQLAGSSPSPLRVTPPRATGDGGVPNSSREVADKPCEYRSYVATQMSPSEQLICSSVPTVVQDDIARPQEEAEMVRQTLTQPASECCRESSTGLEKLLKETLETPLPTHGKETEPLSSSEITGSADRQIASEICPEEVQETVEKTEAPAVTESAFDTGLEKLLQELAGAPPHLLQMLVEEESPREEPSPSEQSRVLGTMPHFLWAAPGASKMKDKTKDLESQVKQCDKLSGGVEAVADFLGDGCGSASKRESPGSSQLHKDYETGATKTTRPPGARDRGHGPFQEPGFEKASKVISGSRNEQPVPLLTNKENSAKASDVELILSSPYKRQDKEREKGDCSDSDFSGRNTGSNAESWRSTSSSEEEPSPVLKTLEKNASRKMPSKSLEDISSDSSNRARVDILPEDLVHSAEDDQKADQEPEANECIPGISTVPSQPDNKFSCPDKLKRMSKSVPTFLQDESDDRETDTASESSYQLSRHKKSPGSLTNLSSSSGMTSLSSVSGSVMSIYSGDFGNLEVKGQIQFAVDYVESLKELHVFVAQCKDLAAADVKKQRSDPYVKTYLLPDKGKMGKKKTLVVKKTLNPVYNEILRYKIEKQILKTQKLNLSVWHRDALKRNSFLGEVELDLEAWDWDNKQSTQLRWYPLKRKTAPVALEAENRGEMKLALQYVPEPNPGKKLHTTGEVHIWVKECLELPLLRGNHLNSFVRCTILPDTSRKSRQKTRAVGKTTHPVFNHTMVYDGFRPEDLREACVELTVWDHYKLTNQFLGGLRIGFGTGKSYGTEVDWMDSTSEEVALWEKMVHSPNTWIEATLPLRMLLIAKISK